MVYVPGMVVSGAGCWSGVGVSRCGRAVAMARASVRRCALVVDRAPRPMEASRVKKAAVKAEKRCGRGSGWDWGWCWVEVVWIRL